MTMSSSEAKHWFMAVAESHLNRFYLWGGDDPSGFDCSGLVVECLKSVGMMKERQDATAHTLWRRFQLEKVQEPEYGALAFFFGDQDANPDKATHIAICLSRDLMLGAEGGGSKVKTEADAIKYNAFIKIRPIASRDCPVRYVNLFPEDDYT